MTPPSASASPNASADDVRVARVHLRLGQLTLARAELEDLLRRDVLDVSGLASLAEARWRTGDGDAAAEAALAHLEAGGSDDVALCIAAEAVAAEGRATEARALMDRLPSSDAARLDALFAGMPRRAFWPAGPVDRSDLGELRREAEARAGRRGAPARGGPGVSDAPTQVYRPLAPESGAHGDAGVAAGSAPEERRAVPGPREVLDASSAWAMEADQGARADAAGNVGSGRRARAGERRVKAQMDPGAELARAREELGARPERALLRLSLVLRHDPTYAPAVLEILHLRREPTAALIRGDAQRLLGRHLEAEAAFDAAAESLEVS